MLQGAVSGEQRSTIDVDNAPGFTQGIRGPTLIERSVWEAVASGARCQPSILSRPQTVVASCAGVMLVAKTQTPPQVITPLAHGAVALVEAATGMWLSPQHRSSYGICDVVASRAYVHAFPQSGPHVGARSSDGTSQCPSWKTVCDGAMVRRIDAF